MPPDLTAKAFIERLEAMQSEAELKKYERYFPAASRASDKFMGVRMGNIFKLAKEYTDMSLTEVERLLESKIHEARVGAVSIMDFQARSKKSDDARKTELFELYLRRIDRINTWDLVDRSGFNVVGSYLIDHPEKISVLEKLAHGKTMAECRTAIVAAGQIALKTKQTDKVFEIAALLIHDKDEFVQKAVGWMLRVAGDIDHHQLEAFLDKHAGSMPRIMLRNAIEKLDKSQKDHYMTLK